MKDVQNEKTEIYALYNKIKRRGRGRDSIERIMYMKDHY